MKTVTISSRFFTIDTSIQILQFDRLFKLLTLPQSKLANLQFEIASLELVALSRNDGDYRAVANLDIGIVPAATIVGFIRDVGHHRIEHFHAELCRVAKVVHIITRRYRRSRQCVTSRPSRATVTSQRVCGCN